MNLCSINFIYSLEAIYKRSFWKQETNIWIPECEVLELRNLPQCKATCQFFRCGQRALYIKSSAPQQRGFRSNPWEQRGNRDGTPFCNWVGDVCVVARCNYAFCEKRALLPNGTCGLQERESARPARSIEEEARREEEALRVARERLLKKTGHEFIE